MPTDKTDPQGETKPAFREQFRTAGLLSFAPLVSLILFFVLFQLTADRISLDKSFWPDKPGNPFFSGPTQTADAPAATDTKKKAPPPSIALQELSIRLFWAICGIVFVFACLVVIARSIWSAAEYVALKKKVCIAFVVVAGGLFLFFESLHPGLHVPTTVGGQAGEQLLKAVAGLDTPVSLQAPEIAAIPAIGCLTNVFSDTAKIGFIFVAVCVSILLMNTLNQQHRLQAGLQDVGAVKLAYERLIYSTRILMELTAVALVCGVIEIYFLYLMASYHVRPDLHTDVRYFAVTLATAGGLVYSGFLVAIFLPILAAQKTLCRKLNRALQARSQTVSAPDKTGGTEPEPDDDITNIPVLKSALTAFAPLLTALVTMLASHLSSLANLG